ncbi:MAG: dihydroorotate dehydrogenase (quinone) [Gammaproteobacteria bacterium RIFCSPHIGHO2_12_FULL_43_28]|nr:MAG: dihydroorotate dehydrogenase (quinone) [Gammaproteobacteria bacterium RIFCSPHIGHO2_12_FULL_43_28]
MYSLIKKILFLLDPETSHTISLKALKWCHRLGLTKLFSTKIKAPCEFMGLHFENPIGLAAGLDKNADYVDALSDLGFGFIEIGTVTPRTQMGNPKPRLFRLVNEEAIINRMGFNNKGADYVVKNLKKSRYRGVLGINIGKNKETPLDQAADDYVICFRKLAPFASYITINISSPNTPDLRNLQASAQLDALLTTMKAEQQYFNVEYQRYVPLVVKIAPDLTDDEVKEIAAILIAKKIDGVIATNTTISRDGINESRYKNEAGGLSGKPLQKRSADIIKKLHQHLQDRIPIIGVGGIMDEASANEKWKAGAKLLQIYTGFIFKGPGLIKRLSRTKMSS